jgi:hypothetical protein
MASVSRSDAQPIMGRRSPTGGLPRTRDATVMGKIKLMARMSRLLPSYHDRQVILNARTVVAQPAPAGTAAAQVVPVTSKAMCDNARHVM